MPSHLCRKATAIAVTVSLALFAVACSDDPTPGTIMGADGGLAEDELGGIGGGDSLFGSKDAPGVPDMVQEVAEPKPLPGTFGWHCADAGECDSGICVETSDGKVCSKTCSPDCPSGWKCSEEVSVGGDTTFLCMPRHRFLCDPCEGNKDCNGKGESDNLCISFGNAGSFCGAGCDEFNPQCPSGYTCQAQTNPATGMKSHQCSRTASACECSLKAKQLGLTTACVTANLFGKCKGSRMCTADGLTSCGAPVAVAEECDGKDNDCNGKTDDFDASATCDKTNEFGKCKGIILACVDGKTQCDAPAAQPEACNGKDDNCNGTTDEGLCDDGDPCTTGTCNTDGSCKQTQLAGLPCDDANTCTTIDKCLSGKCTGGAALNCDDQDPCTSDACDPFTGCTHKAASDAVCTDDGNACTIDVCKEGKCVHPPSDGNKCTDDGIGCTQDVCQAGKCVHPPQVDGGPCTSDGKPCTKDVCNGGKCTNTPDTGSPCDDDGIACTNDVCKAGVCDHPANSAACEDGNICTENDKCVLKKCAAGLIKKCDDGNPCTTDSCDKNFGCVKKNNDFASCVASSAKCPVGQCSGGSCFSKPNTSCLTKVKTSLCESAPVAGTCSASGECAPNAPPGSITCAGSNCNGICVKCFVEICFPIFQ